MLAPSPLSPTRSAGAGPASVSPERAGSDSDGSLSQGHARAGHHAPRPPTHPGRGAIIAQQVQQALSAAPGAHGLSRSLTSVRARAGVFESGMGMGAGATKGCN